MRGASGLVVGFAVSFAAIPASWAGTPQWNNTRCPSFSELRAPHVAEMFNTSRDIPGFYYELALHDVTQYPLCPAAPRCVSSNKTLARHPDGQRFVHDAWNLYCAGKYYPQTLLFNTTREPGYLRGYVPSTKIPFLPKKVVAGLLFPDTVVDFKEGGDGWLLEFQCLEHFGKVIFVGINFYSKADTDAAYQEMLAAGLARGLDFYWSQGRGLSRVNHTGCPTPPVPNAMSTSVHSGA